MKKKQISKTMVSALVFFAMSFAASVSFVQADAPEALQARNEALKLQQQGYYQAAIEKIKQAITLDPQYAAAHNDLGVLYEETNQAELALASYQKAVEIDPNYAGAYTNLAAFYEGQGNLEQAMQHWQKRSQMGGPEDPWRIQSHTKVKEIESLLSGKGSSPDNGAGYEFTSLTSDVVVTKAESPARKIKRLISEAKKDGNQYRYLEALEKLEEARQLAPDAERMKEIEDVLTEIREKQINYDTARASAEVGLYKQAKMVEVENAWYPPTPELDAGKKAGGVGVALSAKTPARLLLEKKANQIIPSIDFNDAQLKDVIEFLASSNDINIVIDEEVVADASGVTVHLKNIPLVEALDIILRTKGLKYRFEENIIWITTGEKLAQEDLVVKVYDVQDLVNKLHDFPSTPFDIQDILKDSGNSGNANNNNSNNN